MQIEVTVIVDGSGDFGVGKDLESARQNFIDDIGTMDEHDSEGYRVFQLNLDVPVPETLILTGSVPEQGGEVKLTVQ